MHVENIVLLVLGIWLLALSLSFFFLDRFLRRLTKGAKELDLKAILDKILATESKNSQELVNLGKEIRKLEEDGLLHIQKIGLVRFNPFEEIGGDHSFSLALLDAKNTGIVITGLHTRERTRVYVKGIKNGKAEHELSAEEKRALTKAQKL